MDALPADAQALAAALRVLAEVLAPAIARAVVAELRAGDAAGMIDQSASPLGRRRHIAAVRRIVSEGKPGAAIVGRRYLLARDALERELAQVAKRAPKRATRTTAPAVDELAALRDRYGLERAS